MGKIVLWGIGDELVDSLLQYKWNFDEIVALIDSDENKWGKVLCSKKINAPEILKTIEFDYIIIMSGKYFENIKNDALAFTAADKIIGRHTIENKLSLRIMRPKYINELGFWLREYLSEKGFCTPVYIERFLGISAEKDTTFFDGKIIADFGCGPMGSLAWARNAKLAVGIDVLVSSYFEFLADEMSKHNMWYLQSTENRIPISDESVDVVSTINSIDHVENFSCMFDEVTRILKPQGTLLGSFNLNELPTVCEPQILREAEVKKCLLKHYKIISYRIAYMDNEEHYGNFRKNKLVETLSDDKPALLWVRAVKL